MNRLELSARSRVRPGKLDGFKATALEFVRQTREKDTRTLRFDWYLSRDQVESELREEYLDAQGFVEHKMHTAEITEALFAEFATDHQVAFFGDPSPELVQKVEQTPMGRTVTWFTFFQGFGSEPTSFWDGSSPTAKPGLELGAHMTVRPGQEAGFREQAAEMLRLAREKDSGTLRYDWFISRDGTRCDVREAYVDVSALVEHNANIAPARDLLFQRFADGHFMTSYGEFTSELRALVEATHMQDRFKSYILLAGLSEPAAATEASRVQPAVLR